MNMFNENERMREIAKIIFLLFLFTGVGCEAVGSVPKPLTLTGQESDQTSVPDYYNARFGYALDLPEGYSLYALSSDQTAIHADSFSEIVFLVEGETNYFTIRGIEEEQSVHEWITRNLTFFYPTGDAAQRVEDFAGEQAIYLAGQGQSDSPAQVIVTSHGKNVIVISFEREAAAFETILQSFVFVGL